MDIGDTLKTKNVTFGTRAVVSVTLSQAEGERFLKNEEP